MALLLDGSSEHVEHIWSKIRYFDLSKAFVFIKRVVKSELFFGKGYFTRCLKRVTHFILVTYNIKGVTTSYVRNMF